MTGRSQARCLRACKISRHAAICAHGYHLNFPSHIVAVFSQSRLVAPIYALGGWSSPYRLPAQGLCGGVVVPRFPLGFVFLYVSCKCYGTEGSFCMQARAYQMACCCWHPGTRIQPCPPDEHRYVVGLFCLPLFPWSGTGLYCESSEITLKLGKYSDYFFLSKIYFNLVFYNPSLRFVTSILFNKFKETMMEKRDSPVLQGNYKSNP